MKRNRSVLVPAGLVMSVIFATATLGEESTENPKVEAPIKEESLGQPFASVSIPRVIDGAGAMNACVKAALGRKWNIVTKQDSILEINLKQKGWDATAYFVVKDDVVVLYSDSYVVNKKTGERKKKKDPDGWLRNLEKDVKVFMDREAYQE
jgi:hypothetical protein